MMSKFAVSNAAMFTVIIAFFLGTGLWLVAGLRWALLAAGSTGVAVFIIFLYGYSLGRREQREADRSQSEAGAREGVWPPPPQPPA